jgi:tRNA 2-thiocytidine biosynthesis protein TtcA
LPVIENLCPTSGNSKRLYIKELLNQMERDNKDVRDNIWRALGHVKPDYLPVKLGYAP